MTSWSVDWELHVESLSSFTALVAGFGLQSEVKCRGLPCASIILAIVELESALDLFGESDLLSDGIDLTSQLLLLADSATIDVIGEAVTLHRGVHLWRPRSWIQVDSLLVSLLGVLKSIIGLVERQTILYLGVLVLHLILGEFHRVARIGNGPIHADVSR